MSRRALISLAAALAVLALGAPAASAHARLEGSTPARGAVLERQPASATFQFSESVEANFGAVRVYDAKGRRVDDGKASHPGGRGDEVAVGLRSGLPEGTHTATYRVVSADSHPVEGGLVFSIGHASAAGATVSDLLKGSRAGDGWSQA